MQLKQHIEKQGDAELRETTAAVIDRALIAHAAEQAVRGHLGMSGIANPDARTLWLRWRWCLPDDVPARTLRIFELGNILEDEVVRLLKLAGFDVWEVDPDTGRQFNFRRIGGHYSGSADGVIRGIPESTKPHVLEIKSAKASKVSELHKLRKTADDNAALKEWNVDYFGQVQCYMNELGLERALFVIYNKDTSELVTLRIKPERFFAEAMQEKAERIITSDAPPASTFPSRDWYEIKRYKSEDYQAVYWGDQLPPRAHCRNCRHAMPDTTPGRVDGAWFCTRRDHHLTLNEQRAGCGEHNIMPALMPAKLVEIHEADNVVEYQTDDGERFFNGGDDIHAPRMFTSAELCQLSKTGLNKKTLCDHALEIRAEFGGRLVEVIKVEGQA